MLRSSGAVGRVESGFREDGRLQGAAPGPGKGLGEGGSEGGHSRGPEFPGVLSQQAGLAARGWQLAFRGVGRNGRGAAQGKPVLSAPDRGVLNGEGRLGKGAVRAGPGPGVGERERAAPPVLGPGPVLQPFVHVRQAQPEQRAHIVASFAVGAGVQLQRHARRAAAAARLPGGVRVVVVLAGVGKPAAQHRGAPAPEQGEAGVKRSCPLPPFIKGSQRAVLRKVSRPAVPAHVLRGAEGPVRVQPLVRAAVGAHNPQGAPVLLEKEGLPAPGAAGQEHHRDGLGPPEDVLGKDEHAGGGPSRPGGGERHGEDEPAVPGLDVHVGQAFARGGGGNAHRPEKLHGVKRAVGFLQRFRGELSAFLYGDSGAQRAFGHAVAAEGDLVYLCVPVGGAGGPAQEQRRAEQDAGEFT